MIDYLVNQGTRELGIRMALGATQPTVLRLVVKQGLMLAFTGVAIGLVAASLSPALWAAFSTAWNRLIRSRLFWLPDC